MRSACVYSASSLSACAKGKRANVSIKPLWPAVFSYTLYNGDKHRSLYSRVSRERGQFCACERLVLSDVVCVSARALRGWGSAWRRHGPIHSAGLTKPPVLHPYVPFRCLSPSVRRAKWATRTSPSLPLPFPSRKRCYESRGSSQKTYSIYKPRPHDTMQSDLDHALSDLKFGPM